MKTPSSHLRVSRLGINPHSGWRVPGPTGVSAPEERDWFDPDKHGDSDKVSSYVRFQRVGSGFDAATRLRLYLKCTEIRQVDARGSTTGDIEVYYYLYPLEEGRFYAEIKGAVLEVVIEIGPPSDFPKLDSPGCAKIYAKYSDAELKLKDRTAALRKFFNDELVPGHEPATRDTLPRICTLHHEAGHVHHAEKDYWALLNNFEEEVNKLGRRWSTRSPNVRFLDLARQMWSSWWSDYDKKEHEQIVYEQCELFIKLYEKNRDRGFAKPLVHAGTGVDPFALEALNQINGRIE